MDDKIDLRRREPGESKNNTKCIRILRGTEEEFAILDETLENFRWHDINEELPEPGKYVLLSFENEGILPDIGRYETEDDGSGAFYPKAYNYSYASVGIFVNAWMPLPEPYRRAYEEDESC